MKIGTYFAYWEQEWDVDFFPYIKKVKDLGFDVLEVSAAGLVDLEEDKLIALKEEAEKQGILLTGCLGLGRDMDTSSVDENIRKGGVEFMKKVLDKLHIAGIKIIGGITYAYWPCDYSFPVDKEATRAQSIKSVRELADYAKPLGITLALETVNRFEQYMFNDAEEATQYVKDVDRDNVVVMLDSFHMNIEEDNFGDAIRTAGKYLGHFHIGEANRKVPGKGRLPWDEMADALREINYPGVIVMEPFVTMGGTVGKEIKVWRDLSGNADAAKLDADIAESCAFCKKVFHD